MTSNLGITDKMSKNKATNKKTIISSNDEVSKDIKKSENKDFLTTDDIFRLPDLHFNRENYMFKHNFDSYNKCIEEDIKNFMEFCEHYFSENITATTCYKNWFRVENMRIDAPTLHNGMEPMFPSDARRSGLTYSIKLIADISQFCDIIDIASGKKVVKLIGHKVENYHLATIPLMVKSKWCSLSMNKNMDKTECKYDCGGYFIIKGNEKVAISQDVSAENKPSVYIKKDSGALSYIVQVNSRSYKPHGITQVMTIKIKKDNIMMIRVPILNEVNVCAIFRALGLESDRDIINYISHDEYDTDMADLIRISLDACKNEKGMKISTSEEAIDYLIPKMRILKKYTESDRETKLHQKKNHLLNLLTNNFLPHQEGTMLDKAYYLGYMVNRLLKVVLKRQPIDDRDSYINKRVSLAGDLMFDMFKQQYKKLISECRHFFELRNKSNDTPINIIINIKPNIIEQGYKAALSTGHWIRRQGVAQMLQRLTYLQTISFLRRIDAPGGDASSAKLTSPRHLHPSSIGYLCLDGDSEILMENESNVELIKNLKNGDNVMTVQTETTDFLKEEPSSIYDVTSIHKTNMIEIETISGRKLKCSMDHPIFVNIDNEYKLVNAGDLVVGNNVVVRHYEKYLEQNNDVNIDIDNVHQQIVQKYLGNTLQEKTLEIIARIVGKYVPNNENNFNMVNKNDKYHLISDIKQLLNIDISMDSTDLENFLEAFVSDKDYCVPKWILASQSQRIVREYLSSLNGQFGYHTIVDNKSVKIVLFDGITNETFANDIIQLYAFLGIDNLNKEINNESNFTLECTDYENMAKIVDIVGFRYANEKNIKFKDSIEYVKYYASMEHDEIIGYNEFAKNVNINTTTMNVCVPIKSIKNIDPQLAYDFTTLLNTHTFIANGFVTHNCPAETPEHAKVGLTKHLSLIGSVSIMSRDQYSMLKDYMSTKVTCLSDISPMHFRDVDLYKVFLNGTWMGVTTKYLELLNEMNKMKLNGEFDQKNVSIVGDHEECEIRVYCDSGRMNRPTLRVIDNEILLTKEHIKSISLNKSDKLTKVTDWDEFLIKYPGVVEYIDTELQPFLMIADKVKKVRDMKQKMDASKVLGKNIVGRHVDNRYDNMFFLNYSHCEIHPCLLVGEIITNIPFFDRNAGPRSIFAYAQGRQAMGIFATNYRDRLDISFIMYYPQRPLVSTRTAKYTNSEVLPAGENAIVAIACYGGLLISPCHSTKLWQVRM